MAKRRASQDGESAPPAPATREKWDRARYLDPRADDDRCRIHKVPLDATGYCVNAQAWWVPKFRCPHCAGPLWDNGFCPTCTPKTRMFPGDYFEQRWEANAGRERGHYVRVYTGPSPAPDAIQIQGDLAELRALTPQVGRDIGQVPAPREPGDEPDWVTETTHA